MADGVSRAVILDSSSQLRLNPAARVLWRSAHSVQLELGDHKVVMDGVGAGVVRRLLNRPTDSTDSTDSTDPPAQPDSPALPEHLSGAAWDSLTDAGFLWPAPVDEADSRIRAPRPRLGAELAALTARRGQHAARVLDNRQQSAVAVHGAGRVGPQLAAVLAAAGVGRVHVSERAATRLTHVLPGGAVVTDEGRPLSLAAAAAITRAAPETDTAPLPFGERPDLVVLALDAPVDDDRRDALHAAECAHLLVRLGPDHGVVGPLVIPGVTSCLRCADLHRLDRDPAWNALAVQLSVPHRYGDASQVALAATIAGVAALQTLSLLDGEKPAAIEGSLEIHLPDWRVRRRTWPAHPDCDCQPRRPTPTSGARAAPVGHRTGTMSA
jgi:bacteriocin biosynthesis cyclodehydratase domain-containing protein